MTRQVDALKQYCVRSKRSPVFMRGFFTGRYRYKYHKSTMKVIQETCRTRDTLSAGYLVRYVNLSIRARSVRVDSIRSQSKIDITRVGRKSRPRSIGTKKKRCACQDCQGSSRQWLDYKYVSNPFTETFLNLLSFNNLPTRLSVPSVNANPKQW